MFKKFDRNLFASKRLYILFQLIYVANRLTFLLVFATAIVIFLEFNTDKLGIAGKNSLFQAYDSHVLTVVLITTLVMVIVVNRLFRYQHVFARLDGILYRRLDEMTDYVRRAIFGEGERFEDLFAVEESSRSVIDIDYDVDAVRLHLEDGHSFFMEIVEKGKEGGTIHYSIEDRDNRTLMSAIYRIGQPSIQSPYRFSVLHRDVEVIYLNDYYQIARVMDSIARC